MNDDSPAPEHGLAGILTSDDEEAAQASPPMSSDIAGLQNLPDRASLVEEIGRLAKLVGFLRAENERLAAERHDFRLRLEQSQQPKAREEAVSRKKR